NSRRRDICNAADRHSNPDRGSNRMGLIADSMTDAAELETGAAEQVEAAVAESERDRSPFWIAMLLEAAQKERDSLEAIEQNLDTLRLSLDQRRQTINQQEEVLRDLAESLTQERTAKNATRG